MKIMRFLLWFIPLILVPFWLWMFWEMSHNDELPECVVSVSAKRDTQLDWAIAFVLFNIVTAGYYYAAVFRKR